MTKKPKILVVEDDEILNRLISKKLTAEGMEVLTATNANDALKILDEEGDYIDFAWIDHYLPGEGTGLDLVTRIKGEPNWSGLPVFIVSNYDNKDRYKLFTSITDVKYLIKAEVSLSQIINEIKKILKI